MIYLDNGATSFPKPRIMSLAMEECIKNYCGNPGRSGHYMSIKTGEEIYNARKNIAKLFNINNPERLVFTKNTTEALNLGLEGFLKKGDHVITTSMEHNSVLRPLRRMESRGVEHSIIKADKEGRVSALNIENAIKTNTKLIVMTSASNVTGTKMPIDKVGKLAKERGLLFFVDGAQGAGKIEIDIKAMNIDMFAIPGHKGLLGPIGTGALYVGENIELEPLVAGGTGTESKSRNLPKSFPEGYEAGTLNAAGIIGLGASAEYVRKIGVKTIGAYEEELICYLDEELGNMNFVKIYGPCHKEKTGITLINIRGKDSEEVTEELSRDYGIAVRGGFHCAGLAHKTIGTWDSGAVRISVGPFNTKKDIKTLIEAIWKMGKS